MSNQASSSCRVLAGAAVIAVITALAACGQHGSAAAPNGAAMDAAAGANGAGGSCFSTVGKPSENDAKLYAAAEAGDVQLAAQAIAAGANVKAADLLERTPLFAAAFCNRGQVASLLIDKGADPNAKDFDGMSPLHVAAVVNGTDVANALLAKGADIDSRNAVGRTPIILAAATDQAAMVKLLVAHGANVNLRDKDGHTAASLASADGHATIAEELKNLQAKGRTPSKAGRGRPPIPHAPPDGSPASPAKPQMP